GQRFGGARERLQPGHALDDERDRGVLDGRERREQVVLLEDKADVLAAKCDARAIRHGCEVLAEDVYAAGRRIEQAAMSEMSVVLPQPLGPTSNVSSDAATRRSIPLRTRFRDSPSPNSF